VQTLDTVAARRRREHQGQLTLNYREQPALREIPSPTIVSVKRFLMSRIPQLMAQKLTRALPRAAHGSGLEFQIRRQVYRFLAHREHHCWASRYRKITSAVNGPLRAQEQVALEDVRWLLERLAFTDSAEVREVFSSYQRFIGRLRRRPDKEA
jgi:hypothetical protein